MKPPHDNVKLFSLYGCAPRLPRKFPFAVTSAQASKLGFTVVPMNGIAKDAHKESLQGLFRSCRLSKYY